MLREKLMKGHTSENPVKKCANLATKIKHRNILNLQICLPQHAKFINFIIANPALSWVAKYYVSNSKMYIVSDVCFHIFVAYILNEEYDSAQNDTQIKRPKPRYNAK